MIKIADPVRRWTRQLGDLRLHAAKNGRAAGAELIEEALGICDALLRDFAGLHLECDKLRGELRASYAAWDHLFEAMPAACVLTDDAGAIVEANRAAGAVLNLSPRALKGRQLMVFAENRPAFETLLRSLAADGEDEHRARLLLRPRDRKPSNVDVVIVPLHEEPSGRLLWFLGGTSDPAAKAPDGPLHSADGPVTPMISPEPM